MARIGKGQLRKISITEAVVSEEEEKARISGDG